MNHDVLCITKAMNFAARKHVAQRRKGESAEPYINHCLEVGALIAEHTHGLETDIVIGAILHDTIEDTETTKQELTAEFGAAVAGLVGECSDDKSLSKQERKRLQIANAAHKSNGAKMIKMGDKISNLRSILSSPPPDWDLARKIEYFDWAKQVVDQCRGVNAGLEQEFDKLYTTGKSKLMMAA